MSKSKIIYSAASTRAGRRSLLAATIAVILFSFGGLGTAFSQDTQSQPAQAQPGPAEPGPGMGHRGGRQMPSVDDQIKHMTKRLNLSDDQQAKLKPILEGQRAQMDQIWKDSSLSREDRFSKVQSLHENTDGQIKGVLNEDQQKKFDKMQQERHDHMRGHWGDKPNGGPEQQQ